MAQVLVTGGAGYIGSHACRALAAAGHVPVVFDSFVAGWRDAVRFGPAITGDLRDRAALEAALRDTRPAAVLHFAGLIEVGASVDDPAGYWSANLDGTRTLLDAMRACAVDRLVFSSTCAVNGDCDGLPVDEATPCAPLSPYAATKAAAERMIADYVRAYGLRALSLRYFNVAGADAADGIGEQHRPETHLVPRALAAAAGDGPALQLYGDDYPTRDGTCIRDYVHVRDLAEAHVAAIGYLDRDARAPVICLGTGHGMSVREMLDAIAATTGRAVPHRIAPRRPGDAASLVCGSDLARRALDWVPARSTPAQMIADAWAWQRGPGHAG